MRRYRPTDGSALDNAILSPACRKRPLTPVLYCDAIGISGVPLYPVRAPGVNPQAAEATPGGFSLASADWRCVAGRCRTSGLAPRSAKPRHLRAYRAPCRPTTFKLLGLAQHCIGSRSLSQVIDRCPTSIALVEERIVVHGSVDSDRKLIGLAGLALCHENLRRLVSH